jgi:glycogen debranching enzyme
MDLLDEAHQHALAVLEGCIDSIGIKASAFSNGYTQVWARDSMITFLGAALTGNPAFRISYGNSLRTLARHQHELGFIANNVDTRTGTVSYGAADAIPWFIIGLEYYVRTYQDAELLAELRPALEKSLLALRYQDITQDGLLTANEARDWADLLANHGHVLYSNVLYVGALRSAARLFRQLGDVPRVEHYAAETQRVIGLINLRLWITNNPEQQEAVARMGVDWERDFGMVHGLLMWRPYYLAYIDFRSWGDYCDGLGNVLAVLLDVAPSDRAHQIIHHLHATGMTDPFPLRVLDPVIHEGSPDWREYYRNFNLNRPYQYHNGGIWPFAGGFYVAMLVKAGRHDEAGRALVQLAELNRQGRDGEWEFNEWMHGKTGRPMGNGWQAWSAGMFLFARHCVETKQVPYFGWDA